MDIHGLACRLSFTHTHSYVHDLSGHVRTLYRRHHIVQPKGHPLWCVSSQTHHFICPFNFVLPQLTSVMSFYTPAEGGKVLTWTLVPWISCQQWESADTANCLRKKSQQRSEIKCRQLLLCILELLPSFNISYLLSYLLWLFIDDSGQFLELGSRHQGCRQHNKMSFHRLWFCQWLCLMLGL